MAQSKVKRWAVKPELQKPAGRPLWTQASHHVCYNADLVDRI